MFLRMGGYAAGLPEGFNAIGDELAESRSVATGSVLCKICGARGKQRSTLLAVLRRSRPFPSKAFFKIGVKRPALSWGRGGDASSHRA